MRQNYWLHNWLDEHDLQEAEEVSIAVKDPKKWSRLIELAHHHEDEPPIQSLGPYSVAAGRSLDLTGFLACGHPECISRQVDVLFSRVWHYFDTIAVVGVDAHNFLDRVAWGEDSAKKYIAGISQVIFHAEELGVDDLLLFVAKPPACPIHWPEYSSNYALRMPEHVLEQHARRLTTEGRIRLGRSSKGKRRLVLHHPALWNGQDSQSLNRVAKERRPTEDIEHTLARLIVEDHALGAASDLFAAEQLGLPIGAAIPLETQLLTSLRPAVTEQEVAFQLRLPVVEGLSTKELLAIRHDEHDAFVAFRKSLHEAMKERVRNEGLYDPHRLARQIENEVIEPALSEIRRRLAAVERTLTRRHVANLGLGALSTVCGLLGQAPLASGLVTATAIGAVAAQIRAAEEKAPIELSNMWFLWEVDLHIGRAARRKSLGARKKNKKGKIASNR